LILGSFFQLDSYHGHDIFVRQYYSGGKIIQGKTGRAQSAPEAQKFLRGTSGSDDQPFNREIVPVL
jgi:hypothetical protein